MCWHRRFIVLLKRLLVFAGLKLQCAQPTLLKSGWRVAIVAATFGSQCIELMRGHPSYRPLITFMATSTGLTCFGVKPIAELFDTSGNLIEFDGLAMSVTFNNQHGWNRGCRVKKKFKKMSCNVLKIFVEGKLRVVSFWVVVLTPAFWYSPTLRSKSWFFQAKCDRP